MIDTANEMRCKNAACGKPIVPILGHRHREYCNDTCKQTAYRMRKEQHPHHVVTIVDDSRTAELEQRIAHLEHEVQRLQERLAIEQRYRTDTQVRHFKAWIRSHPQPQDSNFPQRFLADSRLPQHASRSLYAARLKQYGYSDEDIFLFQERWKDMLFTLSSPKTEIHGK